MVGGQQVLDGDLEIGAYLSLAGLTGAIATKVGELVLSISLVPPVKPALANQQ